MFAWAMLLYVCCHLPIEVLSQTLSLQGNVVFDPIKSSKQTAPTLRECARICMERPLCWMLIYNMKNQICETASVLSKTPTRRLNQYELAYLRGMQCAPDRRMVIRTRKGGKLYLSSVGHRYLPSNSAKEYPTMQREDNYCNAMDDIPECDLVSFGSADGGKSLTKITTSPNYVHYGYCAVKNGSCNAHHPVSGYLEVTGPLTGDYLYDLCPKCETRARKLGFLCYFWKGKPCAQGKTSEPFSYAFRMKY